MRKSSPSDGVIIRKNVPQTIKLTATIHKHDDVIKCKHFPRYRPFVRAIHRSPVNSPHKGQWRGALMFSLICACINGWVNNGEAGDLRRHRPHYVVIVMDPLQKSHTAPVPYPATHHFIRRMFTTENAWVRIQHCSYWCPGAKAPGQRYPQCSLYIHCLGPVSYRDVIVIGRSSRNKIIFQ